MKTDKKLDLAIELIKIMNTRGKYIRMINKTAVPPNLKGLKELIVDEADKNVDALLNSVAVTYASAFSEQDFQGMIDFFNSEIGKKYIDADLKLELELSASSMEWYRIVLQNAEERYQKEYLKRKAEEGINPSDYIPPLNIGR
jgi:hypothetical protein